jgi:single-strand DNA-binding protein
MASFNRVMLLGNLTRDPEVRHTPKGTAVGDLSMAISEKYKTQDGTEKEEVVYVDVVVWGRQAETCKEYLTKGSPIFVEGRLQLDQWESQQGEKKSKIRVRADRVQFLGGRGGASGGGSGSGGGRSYSDRESAPRPSSPSQPAPRDDFPPDLDDEVPF